MIKINLIRQNGGLIAGQGKTVDLWICGGIITITNKTEVELIEAWIRAAEKWANGKAEEINNYVAYMLDESGIL